MSITVHPLVLSPAEAARQGGTDVLAQALCDSRQDTLATLAAYQAALPELLVPQHEAYNLPLWELGHIGWFQTYWLARNPQRHLGWRADPDVARPAPARANADALYDSSRVPHAARWQLPLPSAEATRLDLQDQLAEHLALLRSADETDDGLYFFRLALLHEDMHHEAALYMAQALGIPVADQRWQAQPLVGPRAQLPLPASRIELGHTGPGFAFDNECGRQVQQLPGTAMDSRVLSWADYLPFAEAGGYQERSLWTEAGWAWRLRGDALAPRYVRQQDQAWQVWRHGAWQPLDLQLPACHLTMYEAEAWCRWAGRRLPSEAEWQYAALHATPGAPAFQWGQVWEWTASTFLPYPGFQAHPYRDYSAPWFGDRPVLRGGSFMTQPRMKHPHYRNYFPAWRNDVPAGFRSCAR